MKYLKAVQAVVSFSGSQQPETDPSSSDDDGNESDSSNSSSRPPKGEGGVRSEILTDVFKGRNAAEKIDILGAAVATVIKQNVVLTVSMFVLTSYFINALLKLKEFI